MSNISSYENYTLDDHKNFRFQHAFGSPNFSKSLCLTKKQISDDEWHTVLAFRLGHSLILKLDDGDSWKYNETVYTREHYLLKPILDFWVDVREGVLVGGVPEHIKKNISLVYQDLTDSK